MTDKGYHQRMVDHHVSMVRLTLDTLARITDDEVEDRLSDLVTLSDRLAIHSKALTDLLGKR